MSARKASNKAEHRRGTMPPPQGAAPAEPAHEPDRPVPYDPIAVGRVASRVEIFSIELLASSFDRADDGPLPEEFGGEFVPEIGVGGIEAAVSADGSTLGCVANFVATFDEDPEPYSAYARFRLLYSIEEGPQLDPSDVRQFAEWNAVFNAWPYWREYVSSVVNRAQLPRFVVPVMGIPLARS